MIEEWRGMRGMTKLGILGAVITSFGVLQSCAFENVDKPSARMTISNPNPVVGETFTVDATKSDGDRIRVIQEGTGKICGGKPACQVTINVAGLYVFRAEAFRDGEKDTVRDTVTVSSQ